MVELHGAEAPELEWAAQLVARGAGSDILVVPLRDVAAQECARNSRQCGDRRSRESSRR
jgi:hypothetical protein